MKKRIVNNSNSSEPQSSSDRAERLAKTMRENLKKRKVQARAQGRAPIKQIKDI